jgi:hypothetical protein
MVPAALLEHLSSKEEKGYTEAGQTPESSVSTTDGTSTNEVSMHDGKIAPEANALKADDDAIVDGNINGFIKTVLDQAQVQLALSENIQDVANVFKQVEVLIGKAEFVLAMMISTMCRDRLYKTYGYASISKFIDDLPSVCRVSRQTFSNAAQVGFFISLLPAIHIYSPADPSLYPYSPGNDAEIEKYSHFISKHKFTPELLYGNYSKIKFLPRMLYDWHLPMTEEVFVNFRDMTYREFEAFLKEYRANYNAAWNFHDEPLQKKVRANQPKPQPTIIPDLTKEETEICRGIHLGRSIGLLFSSDRACVESVARFLIDARQRRQQAYDAQWGRNRYTLSEFFPVEGRPPLSEIDWATMHPGDLFSTKCALASFVEFNLPPREIKKAFEMHFKTKTELTIAQAYSINRMQNDPKLHGSLLQYLIQNAVERQNKNPVMDFVLNVFGIEESRYKWLKRLGANLPYLAKLKGRVSFTSEKFLEKLSYLGTAIQNHADNLGLVVDALNTVSAKRFRKFARDKHDDLSSDPITLNDYRRAKPFIDQLHSYLAEKKPISVVWLASKEEQQKIDDINEALEFGNSNMRRFYPGIIWDSSPQAESAAEISSENGESAVGMVISAEEAFKDGLCQNSDENLLKPAA